MPNTLPQSVPMTQGELFPQDFTSSPGSLRIQLACLRDELTRTEKYYRRLGQKREALQQQILALVQQLDS